jgi:V8-like Glu-specific endopeptidase
VIKFQKSTNRGFKIMNLIKYILLACSLTPIISTTFALDKAIYGDDNRQEAYQVADNRYAEFARSVAAKVKNSDLTYLKDGSVDFIKQTLHQFNYSLTCNNMAYRDQYILAQCTGFLVAPDILVTAGHCARTVADCQAHKWVFDFVEGEEQFTTDNIYSCAQILEQAELETWYRIADYAVIKLDRKVTNRTPLKFRTKGKPKKNSQLAVIGFSQGLPMKYTDDAQIKKISYSTLFTNSDTFTGNSGSPVFNLETGNVEGLIYRGYEDLQAATGENGNFCIENKKFPQSNLVERVYRITKIKYLKNL